MAAKNVPTNTTGSKQNSNDLLAKKMAKDFSQLKEEVNVGFSKMEKFGTTGLATVLSCFKKSGENDAAIRDDLKTVNENVMRTSAETNAKIKENGGMLKKLLAKFEYSAGFKAFMLIMAIVAVLVSLPYAIAAKLSAIEVFGVVICAVGVTLGILSILRDLFVN